MKPYPARPVRQDRAKHPGPVRSKLLEGPRRFSRRSLLGLMGGVCGPFATATLAQPASAPRTTTAGLIFYNNFAGMQLTDQAGRPLRLDSLSGKIVLFNFIFTACSTVCPVQTQALVQMMQGMNPSLRAQVHLISVSLDPLSDTPQTLTAFARRFRVDHTNWSFATGQPGDIKRLADTLTLFRGARGRAPLDEHATALWLVDGQGVLRIRYAGNPPDVARIARELEALVALGASQRLRPVPQPPTRAPH